MKTSLIFLCAASLGLFLACQNEAEGPSGDGDGDGDSGDGDSGDGDGDLGGAGMGGDGDSGDGDGDSGDGDGDQAPRCGVAEEPGTQLTSPASEGDGRCAGVSAEEFASAVRDLSPELADVTEMANGSSDWGNPAYYVAFMEDDGGLRAVFQLGDGDCPSGCIDRVFYYFEADDSCDPVQIGSYSNVQDYEENCREISGEPMWGNPVASPTSNSCEQRQAPVIEGTFEIPFTGTQQRCSSKGTEAGEDVSGTLELTISPSPDQEGEALITFGDSALDLPWLESTEFTAVLDYLQVQIETQWDNTPTTCLESYNLSMHLDLEVCFEGHLTYEEAIDTECNDDLCKGSTYLDLDLSALRSVAEGR